MTGATDITVRQPDTTQIAQRTTAVLDSARVLTIATAEDYSIGSKYLQAIKAMRDEIATAFDGSIKAAHQAHKTMIAAKRKYDDPLAEEDASLRRRMGSWQTEVERKRREEQERIRQEEQRKAEERRLAEAVKLEEQGRNEEAERLVEAPVQVVTPIVPTTVPKEEGVSSRRIWKFRIVDASLIPREYLMPCESAIRHLARTLKDQARLPGVEFYAEESIAVRSPI